MKFIPILFSTPMVEAILEGRKTMTRRIIKQNDQPYLKYDNSFIDNSNDFGWVVKHPIEGNPIRYEITQSFKCPYGQVGDVLWVRETFCVNTIPIGWPYHYKAANDTFSHPENEKWKPSLFMPKDACRIFLEVTEIRVERLNDISASDAVSEGIEGVSGKWKNYLGDKRQPLTAYRINSFISLWKSINGPNSWEENPFVWAISFKRIEKPENFK